MQHLRTGFDRVRTPIVSVNALDDAWAPPSSRNAFMAGYRRTWQQHVDVDPVASGIGAIGHMGYFRPTSALLWEATLAWFDGRGSGGTPGFGTVAN